SAPDQVLIVQWPTKPRFQEGTTLAKKLAAVGVGGFFLPFALLIGWNLLHGKVFDRQQLEHGFDVRIVSEGAALPTRPLIPRPGGERAYQLQSHLFEESVNALRTALTVDERHQDCQVLVMASAVSGEGKSNLASQLAMSFSHVATGKVIIVDGD